MSLHLAKKLVACAREGCDHGETSHFLSDVTVRKAKRHHGCTWCSCPDFQRPGHLPKGTKRSIRKYAGAAERKVAEAMNGIRRGGVGQPDVLVHLANGSKLNVEVKQGKVSKKLKDAWEQAHAQREAGSLPMVGLVDKPGPGGKGTDFLLLRLEDWSLLMERLGVEQ